MPPPACLDTLRCIVGARALILTLKDDGPRPVPIYDNAAIAAHKGRRHDPRKPNREDPTAFTQ